MIKEFSAFFTAFKKGKELTNSATWKNVQLAGSALFGLLSSLVVIAAGFGYDIRAVATDTMLQQASAGIAALYFIANGILTVVTTSKLGIKGKK
ncbi:MAG: hypothetical protein ACXWT0_01560 [Methylobacter sp.]